MTGRDLARPTTPASTTSRLPGILTASKAPRLLGALTYVVGTLDLLTGLLHSWRVHLHGLTEVLPGALSDAAAAATVVSGIFLIVLGHSLKRRKRRAWRAAVALLTLSVVLHAIKTEPASAVISLVGLALLVRHRAEFRALGDPSTRWRAVRAFVLLLVVSVVPASSCCGSTGATSSAASPGPATSCRSSGSGWSGWTVRWRSPRTAPPTSSGPCCWGWG